MSREQYPNLCDRPNGWETRVKPKLDMISGWARNGLSNVQIAQNLGISVSAFDKYRREHEELVDALNQGKEDAEVIVENALFKRATGYKYKEITKMRQKVYGEDGDWTGEYKMVVTKKVTKEVPADVGAAQYWLEHRAPKRWEKNPLPGLDAGAINTALQSLALLVSNPVQERAIGSENE